MLQLLQTAFCFNHFNLICEPQSRRLKRMCAAIARVAMKYSTSGDQDPFCSCCCAAGNDKFARLKLASRSINARSAQQLYSSRRSRRQSQLLMHLTKSRAGKKAASWFVKVLSKWRRRDRPGRKRERDKYTYKMQE